MNAVIGYLKDVLGVDVQLHAAPRQLVKGLPLYISETYKLYELPLFKTNLVLAEYKYPEDFGVSQTDKHFNLIRKSISGNIALLIKDISAFNRKRLIAKGINFIVPGKQLFLPDLLMDLREINTSDEVEPKHDKLLPSAQLILLHHILKYPAASNTFKEMAQHFGYSAMAIGNAIDSLSHLGLVRVFGSKEKSIEFDKDTPTLWHELTQRDLWISPVFKKVFVDELPRGISLPASYTSALPFYSDMNASQQEFFAIDKPTFFKLKKDNSLINLNGLEGKYCLEVWKYDPSILGEKEPGGNEIVDPLSLYLSLKDMGDERIEMALNQIIKKYIQ